MHQSKLGIATTTPTYTLDVNGDAGFNEYLYHNEDDDTHIRFQDNQISLTAGNENKLDIETI